MPGTGSDVDGFAATCAVVPASAGRARCWAPGQQSLQHHLHLTPGRRAPCSSRMRTVQPLPREPRRPGPEPLHGPHPRCAPNPVTRASTTVSAQQPRTTVVGSAARRGAPERGRRGVRRQPGRPGWAGLGHGRARGPRLEPGGRRPPLILIWADWATGTASWHRTPGSTGSSPQRRSLRRQPDVDGHRGTQWLLGPRLAEYPNQAYVITGRHDAEPASRRRPPGPREPPLPCPRRTGRGVGDRTDGMCREERERGSHGPPGRAAHAGRWRPRGGTPGPSPPASSSTSWTWTER